MFIKSCKEIIPTRLAFKKSNDNSLSAKRNRVQLFKFILLYLTL